MRRLAWILVLAAAACASSRDDASASADLAVLAEGVPVDVHDVAVLFPLPARGVAGDLWPASRDVGGRALLPASVVDHLGDIADGDSNATTYASLRVVSLRLEPCFVAAGASPDACERQIRFVLQPVAVDAQGVLPTTTLDAAVHVIHALPSSAFAELVRGIVALRPADAPAASGPLGVHPVLAAEGLAGPFARALEERVMAAVAKGRLARVTFTGVRGRGNEWQLGGVEVAEDGTITPLPIPASGARLQSLVLQRGAQTFAKSISPQTAGTDDVSLLFDSLSAASASHDEIAAALHAANRIENPDVRTSENTDCATCHTIASSRLWAEKTFGQREQADRFAAPGFALEPVSPPTSDLGVIRALGYFGSGAVISPRAANDTAKAAQTIRKGSRGPK